MQKAISVTSRDYAKMNLKVYYNEDRMCAEKDLISQKSNLGSVYFAI